MRSVFQHRPVLLDECIELLALKPGSLILDGTVGGGGHAAAILERTAPDGKLLGLDRDPAALAAAAKTLERFGARVELIHASYRDITHILTERKLKSVDGVLLDLGVSSYQIDTPERGFRFSETIQREIPLDMRMDPHAPRTAADLLARASQHELQEYFQNYGELPGARRLAAAIVEARQHAPIRTTKDLLQIIREARIGGGRKHNPATLVFQALRIAVNDELHTLEQGLEAILNVLGPKGRVAIIAYHSLEDRIVKNCFRNAAKGCVCPPKLPVCQCGKPPRLRLVTRKAVTPTESEITHNPRARSARLRVAEKLAEVA